jgi:hypothetical protein
MQISGRECHEFFVVAGRPWKMLTRPRLEDEFDKSFEDIRSDLDELAIPISFYLLAHNIAQCAYQ